MALKILQPTLKKAAIAAVLAFFAGLGITNVDPLVSALSTIVAEVQSSSK